MMYLINLSSIMLVLRLSNLYKTFTSGYKTITVLNNLNFELREGESASLLAPSGAGKSTFLQIAATLERPNSGTVEICGKVINELSDDELSQLRSKTIGFVYQFHNLLPDFTVIENVMIPQLIAGAARHAARTQAETLLHQVGLAPRLKHFPNQLSGGEKQRVAIARALANSPKLVLADEPTGNLDPDTSRIIFELFLKLAKYKNTSLIVATHNVELAECLNTQLYLRNGQLYK